MSDHNFNCGGCRLTFLSNFVMTNWHAMQKAKNYRPKSRVFLLIFVCVIGSAASVCHGSDLEACDSSPEALVKCAAEYMAIWPNTTLGNIQSRFDTTFQPSRERQVPTLKIHLAKKPTVSLSVEFNSVRQKGSATLFSLTIAPSRESFTALQPHLCVTRLMVIRQFGEPNNIMKRPSIYKHWPTERIAPSQPGDSKSAGPDSPEALKSAYGFQYLFDISKTEKSALQITFPNGDCANSIKISSSSLA